MKRFAMRCAALSVLGAAMLVVAGRNVVAAKADDDITIKQVMQKVNGKAGLKGDIDGDLKAAPPKWDDLVAKSKELVPLAKALCKNMPPKGEADSWKKLSEAYAKAAEALETAAENKDKDAATAAFKVITTCGGCHMAHRVK